jgi:hypothetical protein
MTEKTLNEAKRLKGEIKKLKSTIKQLPLEQSRYTPAEYRIRRGFYQDTYEDWLITLKETKKKLTLIERIKLVIQK